MGCRECIPYLDTPTFGARLNCCALNPQERTARYLEQLSSGTTLVLSASKPSARAGVDGEIEKITKTVHVRRVQGLYKRARKLRAGLMLITL